MLVFLGQQLIVYLCWFLLFGSDLSEQIKAATKDNHVRAENTQLMLSYQKGQITLPQYKVLRVTRSDTREKKMFMFWFVFLLILDFF